MDKLIGFLFYNDLPLVNWKLWKTVTWTSAIIQVAAQRTNFGLNQVHVIYAYTSQALTATAHMRLFCLPIDEVVLPVVGHATIYTKYYIQSPTFQNTAEAAEQKQ